MQLNVPLFYFCIFNSKGNVQADWLQNVSIYNFIYIQNAYDIKPKYIRFLPLLNKPIITAGHPVAWAKFIISVTLAISFKICRSDITSTLNAPVFEDLDLLNYNMDKFSKAIKDKYIPTTII